MGFMDLWFKECHTENLASVLRVREVIHREKTPFQELCILDTVEFGRALVLDGFIQTTERDEFIYHEMLVHVPLMAHPCPERVLVIGGGDGGAVKEIIKHRKVKRVMMVEIDERVVKACKKYLPELSGAMDDPRVEVRFEDGARYVGSTAEKFDVVIVDSTDPGGPSIGLFTRDFYSAVKKTLNPGGIVVAQSDQVMFRHETLSRMMSTAKSVFPLTKLYLAWVPTYSAWAYGFVVASLGSDPEVVANDDLEGPVRYYDPEVHKAAFVLPRFVKEILEV